MSKLISRRRRESSAAYVFFRSQPITFLPYHSSDPIARVSCEVSRRGRVIWLPGHSVLLRAADKQPAECARRRALAEDRRVSQPRLHLAEDRRAGPALPAYFASVVRSPVRARR